MTVRFGAYSMLAMVFAFGTAHAVLDEPGAIGHWKLAGSCDDSSPQRNHAINHGVDLAAQGADGEPRGSARFDGRRGWLEVPSAPAYRLGTKDFTVAAWVYLTGENEVDDAYGDIISQYDPENRRGFSISITHNTGVTTTQSNTRQLHFGIDNGQLEPEWIDHGRPGQAVLIFALAVYGGDLYAGTCEPGRDQAGRVFRLDGGTRWIDCGAPDLCNSVSALADFGGSLYAGVSKYRLAGSALAESDNPNLGGKVFRRVGDRWEDCGQLPDTDAIGGLVVFRGRLYASSLYRPAGFFRYEGGRDWTSLGTPGGKRVEAMCVYNGQLFATSYDEGHVYRYDGTAWTDCGQVGPPENTQTYAFTIYEGDLYVATWRTGRVYRYRGDHDWEDTGRLGEELEVMGMLVYNGKIYAGTLPNAEVYRFDGIDRWSRIGRLDHTPDVQYRRAWTMAQYQGRLFCGTLPSGHVHSIEAGKNVTWDHSLTPGWHHIAAVRRAGRLELYVDGKIVAQSQAFDTAKFDLTTGQPLKIGYGPNDYFRGNLRDVRLYDQAIPQSAIARLSRAASRSPE